MAKKAARVRIAISILGIDCFTRAMARVKSLIANDVMPVHRQRGFTLLEIVLVIVLAALAFTLMPRLFGSGVSGTELKSSVRSIASSMKLARDAAINTRREAFVTVNVQSHEVSTTFDRRVLKLHDDIALKLFTAQADQISADTARFRFYPDGSSNGGRITLIANTREFAIDIDWLTGRVTVSDSAQTAIVAAPYTVAITRIEISKSIKGAHFEA